jgi:hypothetical protein
MEQQDLSAAGLPWEESVFGLQGLVWDTVQRIADSSRGGRGQISNGGSSLKPQG